MNIFETVKAVLVLDEDGKRLYAKYCDKDEFATNKESVLFERLLLKRTSKPLRTNDELIDHFDDYTVVAQKAIDMYVYIVGGRDENELTLVYLLQSLIDALESITSSGQMLDKQQMMENYSKALIIFDEAVSDGGIILESRSNKLIERTLADRRIMNTEDEVLNSVSNRVSDIFKQIF